MIREYYKHNCFQICQNANTFCIYVVWNKTLLLQLSPDLKCSPGVEKGNYIATHEQLLAKYQSLRSATSLYLFSMLSCYSLDLVVYVYLGIASSHGCTQGSMLFMVINCTELVCILVYLAVQADDCFSDFKMMTQSIRLVNMEFCCNSRENPIFIWLLFQISF